MSWAAVQGMKLKPYSCSGCGSTPMEGTEKESSGPKQAYFAEGVDINWGDALYLCDTCVRILGELRGMIDVERAERLENDLERALTEKEEIGEELERANTRIDRMLDGVKAKKEATKARQPKKKEKAHA